MEEVKTTRQKEAKKLVNKITKCLIVRGNEGITENGWPILVPSSLTGQAKCKVKSLKGQIIPVKITGYKNDQLWGEILSLPR